MNNRAAIRLLANARPRAWWSGDRARLGACDHRLRRLVLPTKRQGCVGDADCEAALGRDKLPDLDASALLQDRTAAG
jgi:hypothetical protein